jgi:hypothetical protein
VTAQEGGASMKGDRGIYRPTYKDKKLARLKHRHFGGLQYGHRGEVKREPSHPTQKSIAKKLLEKRCAEIAAGKPLGPDIEKTTFEEWPLCSSTIRGQTAENRSIVPMMLSLKRMFSLAVIAGKASNCPRVAKLEENNTRKGF